jgi:hypothetical protein
MVNPMNEFSAHDLNGLGFPYRVAYIDQLAKMAPTAVV